MGKKNQGKKLRRAAALPPMGTTPRNVTGLAYTPIEEITMAEFCLEEGLPPCEVHLILKVQGIAVPFILRIKSRRAADELIGMLERHADGVWGDPNP